jgi:type I restriction enzyme, S subunit
MSNPGWKRKKIGELFDVQLGKMLNEKAKKGYLSPYLANFNVRWGSFDLSKLNEMYFSENEKKKFALKNGDLLMCEGGEIGRCAVWNQSTKNIYYQKALHRLRPLSNDISSEFIYYYMQHISDKGELPKIVGESSIAHLTREKLLCLMVPAPTCHEQDQIIDVLSTWDQAIEKIERLISAKEKQFLWLLHNLVTERCANKEWQKIKLGELADIRMGTSPPSTAYNEKNQGLPLLQGKADLINRVSAPRFFTNIITQECFKGDLLLSVRAPVGYVSHSVHHGCIGRGIAAVSIKDNLISDYIFYALLSIEREWVEVSQGGTFDAITSKELRNRFLFIPNLQRQRQIANLLNTVQQKIDLLKKQLDAYRRQKRGLMQKLLTGQWRVNERHNPT